MSRRFQKNEALFSHSNPAAGSVQTITSCPVTIRSPDTWITVVSASRSVTIPSPTPCVTVVLSGDLVFSSGKPSRTTSQQYHTFIASIEVFHPWFDSNEVKRVKQH